MKKSMQSVGDFDKAISKLDSLIASGWAKYKLAEGLLKTFMTKLQMS